jgi:hypothetical protein
MELPCRLATLHRPVRPRLHPILAATAVLALVTLAQAAWSQGQPLDRQGVIQSIRPFPGTTHLDTNATVVFELEVAPEDAVLRDVRWWNLTGSLSGPRADDELEVTSESRESSNRHRLTIRTLRPFLPGEELRVQVDRGLPLADGRRLDGAMLSYWIAPKMNPDLFAGDAELSAEPRPIVLEVDQHLEAGLGPNMAVAADFDRDGDVDLAVSEVLGNDSIQIFLNNGQGRLLPHAVHDIEEIEDPGRFAVADVDGDGLVDLIVIGQESGNLAVLSGDGEGGFAQMALVDLASPTPIHVAVGDIDLDGRSDILVAHLGVDTISRLELREQGSADDTWVLAGQIPVLPDVQEIVIADFNNDLIPDLAVASEQTDMVAVLLGSSNEGSDRFEEAFAIPVGSRPEALCAADLNGDHRIDLVVAHEGSNDIAVLLGRGDGTFDNPAKYAAGDRPFLPALADLNGDGYLDVAVPNLFSDDVTLLMGTADGRFDESERLPVEAGPVAVAAADFDGDAAIDLAVVHSVADNVAIYINRQSETLSSGESTMPRALEQNIPNPFNPNTAITFTLLEPSNVNLVVFNTSGKIVKTLVDERRSAGPNTVYWDGTDELGHEVSSGIYFYRLTTDEAVELRRMTLVR